jgi:hypothetical protein
MPMIFNIIMQEKTPYLYTFQDESESQTYVINCLVARSLQAKSLSSF